jgi:S-adenosylmethionine synthetase
MSTFIFTSESVTEGHPDKICDRISDALLDAYLAEDSLSHVALETTVKNNTVILLGEISSRAVVDIDSIVRKTIRDIGYNRPELGFNADTAELIVRIDRQSPDIAEGVNNAAETRGLSAVAETGAGDQGMVLGFATDETPELMPLPISLAHKLAKRLAKVRRVGVLPYLRPDGKTQVSVKYSEGRAVAVDTVIVSAQHDPDVTEAKLRKDIIRNVIIPVIPAELVGEDIKYLINPTGRFVIGGPVGDSGLTGRKIIVDTYGGYSRHGGGAFSGKDPTKVDRSAAYAARWAAKNVVAAGLAKKCEIQIAYAIGVAHPVSVFVETFGTGLYSDENIAKAVGTVFDFRPDAIISHLGLRETKYQPLAAYGHVGREDLNVSWERTDAVGQLRKYFGGESV